MIVPMKKYDIIVLRSRKDEFLERLQDIGLVDITTTGWEPDEAQREMIVEIDRHRNALARLRAMALPASESKHESVRESGNEKAKKSAQKSAKKLTQKPADPAKTYTYAKTHAKQYAKPYADGDQAWAAYIKASTEYDALTGRIEQARSNAQELEVWGDFDPEHLAQLELGGVVLRYFHLYTKEFDARAKLWEEQYTIVPVGERGDTTYFVAVTSPKDDVMIDAQEDKPLTATAREWLREAETLENQRQTAEEELRMVAASADLIEEHGKALGEQLHLSMARASGETGADGALVIMEGWAIAETAENVDRELENYPDIYYIKSDPTPEDDTPTLLKNNKFNRMFELIGGFYSLPKYGTMDLTAFFGPFYALFFGLCLADAGYGALYFITGLVLRRRVKPTMRSMMNLVTLLGLSTMICGALMDSFFGLHFTDFAPLAGLRQYVLDQDKMFYVALIIGFVQIIFAMTLKVCTTTRAFGFRYALAPLGWMLVLLSAGAWVGLPMAGVDIFAPGGALHPVAIAGIAGGGFLMLFMNSPGKNPFVNFGAGLWNTYNNVTGFLSDFLSYIRLFAIGLSGGILATVFNQLAFGLSPDIPVVRQLVIVIILAIGHGLNLFMSTLSAFVHPMRLTFVEFYGNAGFETSLREFTPLKRHAKYHKNENDTKNN